MGLSAIIHVEIDTSMLEKKLDKLMFIMPTVMESIVNQSMDFIEDSANQLIDSDLKWGHSVVGSEQIRNCWEKQITEKTAYTVRGELKNTSPHARIVEYGGGVRTIIERENGMFPIGMQQGNIVAFSPTFHLQEGKFYLTRASFGNLDAIYSIAQKNVNQAILSL